MRTTYHDALRRGMLIVESGQPHQTELKKQSDAVALIERSGFDD